MYAYVYVTIYYTSNDVYMALYVHNMHASFMRCTYFIFYICTYFLCLTIQSNGHMLGDEL